MALRDWYCEDVLSGNQEVKRVYEDERVLAFHHPRPTSDVHVVVVPKEHVPSLLDSKALDGALLTSMIRAIQQTATDLSLDEVGFSIVANAAAPGVTPHMHWHILKGVNRRQCPHCAEWIKEEAKVCPLCQRDVPVGA